MSDGRHQTATASHQFARGHCRALAAMLEAARGLPDLLKARRETLEARWGTAMTIDMA